MLQKYLPYNQYVGLNSGACAEQQTGGHPKYKSTNAAAEVLQHLMGGVLLSMKVLCATS